MVSDMRSVSMETSPAENHARVGFVNGKVGDGAHQLQMLTSYLRDSSSSCFGRQQNINLHSFFFSGQDAGIIWDI